MAMSGGDPHARGTWMPIRVQLSRRKGWRMPPDTVKVDRATRWGNPFAPGESAPVGTSAGTLVRDRQHAVQLYRAYAPSDPALVAAARAQLRGLNLACWCPLPAAGEADCCHAAVLLEIANG
jgi:hypothetical protein